MALKQAVNAVTAKEAALEAATLKSAAQRLDPKDAITSEGKASREQALAESSTKSATSDRKGVEDYEQALSSDGGGGSGESTADLILSGADMAAAADRKDVSDYDDVGKDTGTGDFANHGGEENFSPFAPSTQAEREAAVAAHLGVSELPPEVAAALRTKEEIQADLAAEAHKSPEEKMQDLYSIKAEYEQFDDLKPSAASELGDILFRNLAEPALDMLPGNFEIEKGDIYYETPIIVIPIGKDEEPSNNEETLGDGAEDSLGCPPSDDEQVPLEVKLKWREAYGDSVPQPGEAAAGGATDPVEGDGTQIFGAGGLRLDQVQNWRDSLVDPPDDATPAVEVLRPDPQGPGTYTDPTDDALDPSGTGPEDDPLAQGHDFSAETGISSRAGSAETDQGDTFTTFDFLALDLRRADEPKDEDFDLLSRQSEPAADIVPDFHLETLPLPGLDLGQLFGNDHFV